MAASIGSQADAGRARSARHYDKVRSGRRYLGDDGTCRRSGDAPVQAEHEGGIERDVQRVGGDRHEQRRPGVLEAAQHAGTGEDGQHEGGAEQADPQVDDCLVTDSLAAAEGRRDLRR
jgi:hypothetical protein